MSIKLGVLVLTICFSLFAGTHLLVARCQTPKEPGETVKKFFEMLGKGEADGLESVFLLPTDITDSEIRDLKMSLLDAANDLRRRGGIKSLTISPQRSVGERAEVKVEYTLADGTTKIDTLVLTYDNGEWKISTTLEPTQAANETGAINSLQAIAESQILYSVTKGRGKFTDLATLGKENMINSTLASGEKRGYLFSSKPILTKGLAMFDAIARPKSTGTTGTGNRSFYCNESMVVYEANGGVPPSATASDRVPKDGSPIR
jgi:hypothetical protein